MTASLPQLTKRHLVFWVGLCIVSISVLLSATLGQQSDVPAMSAACGLIWLTAAAVCSVGRLRQPSVETMLLGAAIELVGLLGEVRIVQHVAAATCLVACCRRVSGAMLLAASLAWLPATDFLAGDAAPAVRFAATLVALGAIPLRHRTFDLPARDLLGPVAIVASIVVAGFVLAGTDTSPSHLQNLPERGLLFRSVELPLREVEQTHLADVDVVKRRYAVPSATFDLLAIDGEANRHAVHDPTFCHVGDGWSIVDRQSLPLESGQAALVRYRRGAESTQCVFWFTNGRTQSASPWWYWSAATLRRLTNGQSGAEPVLVVLQPASNQPPDWEQVFRELPALRRF